MSPSFPSSPPPATKTPSTPTELFLTDILSTLYLRTDLFLLVDHSIDTIRQRLNDGSTADYQSLRTASDLFFSEWRTNVLQRAGRTLDIPADAFNYAKEEARTHLRQITPENISTMMPEASARILLSTRLLRLDESKRLFVLHALLLTLLGLEHYTAHSRVLLLLLADSLGLDAKMLTEFEVTVAQGLQATTTTTSQVFASKETAAAAAKKRTSRKVKIGIAAAAGAAIGITGGVTAPLMIVLLLGMAGTTTVAALGITSILAGSLFGAYGGGMTGFRAMRHAAAVKEFQFVPLRTGQERRLRVGIAISGWLTCEEEVVLPWEVWGRGMEVFCLRWETEVLLRLGNTLMEVLKGYAVQWAAMKVTNVVLLGALIPILWPLQLLTLGKLLDNPFVVARARSDKAGKVLADALVHRAQGERPVTLVGYSVGARVIYTCLQSLAKRKAFGLVEDVILIGAPVPNDASEWCRIRTVAVGRVVNVYSREDYVLAFLYRTSSAQLGVAGLQPIKVRGVENLDVSLLVSGHGKYRYVIGEILSRIGFADLDEEAVAQQREALRVMEEEEEREGRVDELGRGREEIDHPDMAAVEEGEHVEGHEVEELADDDINPHDITKAHSPAH